mmetsp:Transcript_69236/g.122477  ORF Transcript_69236/g.122477 Transcript_69236/m.122477 type:complete len:340 (-) Transcript_69236:45-1064(-)
MAASGTGISARLFGSAVKGAQNRQGSAAAKGRSRGKSAAGTKTSEVRVSEEAVSATAGSSAAAGVRGRGPRTFGGGASSLGGTSEALHGGTGRQGGTANSRASAFARAFGVEEREWEPSYGPARRGRGGRQSPYGPLDDDVDADYNGFPRYSQYDWDEPDWEHDQFEGPQTVGSAIFVRNLPSGLQGHQLKHLFEEAGQIANIQVDNGPLPSATVGYVRQDVAFDAAELFHGRWLQGQELKVTVKAVESAASGAADDDFWRQELRQMKQQGRMMGNQSRMLMDYDDDWDYDPWGGVGSWGKGKGGGKGFGKRGAKSGTKGGGKDTAEIKGMRSALSWDD